jgi:surface carbohydrate biosynthesis protein (TIGR04326 family)
VSATSFEGPAAATLLVWDGEGAPPRGPWRVALWRAFGEPGGSAHSVPEYLEAHAEALRARFLAWVQDLGEARIGGARLVDRLVIRPGLSFWWTTLLTEKSVVNSPQIISVLKLFALEDWLGIAWRGRIVLATPDATLARAFDGWCRNAGLELEVRRLPGSRPLPSAPRPRRPLPHFMLAVGTLLRYLWRHWPLKGTGIAGLRASTAQTTFCSYLFHLDEDAARSGRFATSFWTDLHSVIERGSTGVNWLLMFIAHSGVQTARRARELIERFNAHDSGVQVHAALEGGLGAGVAVGAVRDYLKIAAATLRLSGARAMFRPTQSNLDLWPMFELDWRTSLRGSVAMFNCLMLNLFERVLPLLPKQRVGVYLLENIGWEVAFVHCWKSAGHDSLIGVPHSTVRFWDLRYFFDPRCYAGTDANARPLPDLVAVNGPAAMEAYSRGGFPRERLVEVEALRYLHLADAPAKEASDTPGSLRVLVLGDYMPAATRQQLEWLAAAAVSLPSDTRYFVKPHPASPIDAADYPSLQMEVTRQPVQSLLRDCDVAYTSNMTSAAVDAYSAGIPVVSVLEGETFNSSPLRGLEGVSYVTSPAELAVALRRAPEQRKGVHATGYFRLDKRLPRWRELLGLRRSA